MQVGFIGKVEKMKCDFNNDMVKAVLNKPYSLKHLADWL